jgi:hypothetical protein
MVGGRGKPHVHFIHANPLNGRQERAPSSIECVNVALHSLEDCSLWYPVTLYIHRVGVNQPRLDADARTAVYLPQDAPGSATGLTKTPRNLIPARALDARIPKAEVDMAVAFWHAGEVLQRGIRGGFASGRDQCIDERSAQRVLH